MAGIAGYIPEGQKKKVLVKTLDTLLLHQRQDSLALLLWSQG